MKFIQNLFKISTHSLKRFISGRMFASTGFGVSDLLLYAKLVDEGIVLQTDGSFLAAFWFKGADLETSSDEELAIVSDQLNNAFNLLGSGWLFHVDTIRYLANNYTQAEACFFNDATSLLIDSERRTIYQSEGRHYENAYTISFTYRPKIDLGSKLGLFFRRQDQDNPLDYSYYLRTFKYKLAEITELLTQHLNLLAMNNQEIVSFISWCLTGENVQLNLPVRYGVFLKYFLAAKDLLGGDNPKIGDKFMRSISISGFPNESYPGILDKLNYVDFEYRWNTRFILLNQHEGSKIIERISNLWYQKRISAVDTVKMSLAIDTNIKVNLNSESQYQDAEAARFVNDGGEVKFGFYTATIVILDEDKAVVEQRANQIRNLLRSSGFQSQIERYHCIEAYLGTLPGYSYANVRKWLVHSLNVADIMPSTSIWSGLNSNPCSFYVANNPPLFYARTTGYTPLRLSLHVGDNGHTLILGPTGSGKSTLLNFIIAQHFRYKKARVFVFDKNRSSLPLCYSCNGNFFDLGGEGNTVYFQPLANLDRDLDFDFAANWIEELCILNGLSGKFNDIHRAAIHKGLKLMQKETPVNRRTLSYFRHLVQDYDKSVAAILDNFSQESRELYSDDVSFNSGFIAKIFDASEDLLTINKQQFNVFEMSKLMELGERIVIPALHYLIHTISKQFDSAEPTLMVFDESFLFFNHPLMRERIIEWIKTVRKFNVAIVFATQEIADLYRYEDLKSSLKTNCATKIFLPNRQATTADVCSQYQAMDLNMKQIDLIAHGNQGEYFYFSALGTRRFTLELSPNQATYAFVAKTSQQEIKHALNIKAQYPNDFAYYWLAACGIDKDVQLQWLDFANQVKSSRLSVSEANEIS